MSETRKLEARAAAIEAELDSRRTPSQKQADQARDRQTAQEVPNATTLQVARALRASTFRPS